MTAVPVPSARPSPDALLRLAGLAASLAGVTFCAIQPIHPADVAASVTTPLWAALMPVKLLMCLMFLVGFTGLCIHQLPRAGWFGLGGFVLLTLSWFLQTGLVFAEAFMLAPLAVAAPGYVAGFLGIVSGTPGTADLGALPALYGAVGACYMLGGVLFGVGTWRAGVLPRAPGALLAAAAALTPLAAFLPHDIQRLAAIPVGLAVAWLGWALFTARQGTPLTPAASGMTPHFG